MNKRPIGNIQSLGNNKYLLRFSGGFDDFGKRIQVSKTVYCSNEKEAERLLMEFYAEKNERMEKRNGSIPQTLEQLYEEWTNNHVNKNLADNTKSFYAGLWKNFISDKGKLKLKSMTPSNVYKILDDITGDRTKNAAFKMLKAMLNKALQWGYVDKNICNRLETPKYTAEEKEALTEADIENIIGIIGKEEIKYQAMFYFAVLCGLRRQEIIGMQWTDIDFANNSFMVNRATFDSKGNGTVAKDTKTKKSRRKLFLPDMLKVTILKLQNEQNAHIEKIGDKWMGNDWLFTQWDGTLMNLHTPTNWWRDFVAANNITPITFHGLRHTAATFMIKNNVPISTVSGVLGHANITTTLNTYTHVIEDTKKDAITVMEGMFTLKDKIANGAGA